MMKPVLFAALFWGMSGVGSFAQEPFGHITETQGIVMLKPPGATRWTPASAGQEFYNQDWIRTGADGAHGAQIKFASGAEFTLAPGTFVEITKDGAQLGYGEMQGPDGIFARKSNEPIEKRDAPSPELAGFGKSLTREALGSLIAKIDGRETPLTIGDHHVTVDIRDQIARTVIEESFINSTDETLEGVFYFPLPAGSSISGFGMWINGDLVEADVVEKQRAREIYETILREKRDPGLLEWQGGNIFKASVYPIFPSSEKRIRIEYTQTLPARNGSYRYRYPLQSEMLRNNPLREISINVRVDSATPLTEVSCPTHEARIRTTENGAQAEFSAEKYVPGSDFELLITPKFESTPVSVISHQRGDDGYFMALVTPPGNTGWQRDIVRDGDPLKLILLVDTSGSVSDDERARQHDFLTALLQSLGNKDKIQLATFDVDCHWDIGKWTSADAADLSFLKKRKNMGWSDFEKAFAEAGQRATPDTHIVYIGDGILSKDARTPAALVKSLRKSAGKTTCHSIALGSEHEPAVMRGIATFGKGGAMLSMEGSDTPSSVAGELLRNLLEPGLRQIEVEIKGIKTAGVYPEKLTGIRPGQQAVIIGRFNPDKATDGEMIITGVRNGKKESYRAPLRVGESENSNSFIPRLWARYHLDAILASRDSKKNQKSIIALSERFKIMTPLTSFLVLDSEADRIRFGVERRIEMRDGENFFAEGRERTDLDLARERLKESGTWLREERKRVIAELEQEEVKTSTPSYDAGVGFDWMLGGFNSETETFASKNPITSGLRSGANAIASDAIDALLNEISSNRSFVSGGAFGGRLSNGLDPNNYAFVPPTGAANPVPTGVNPITSGLRSGGNAIVFDSSNSFPMTPATPARLSRSYGSGSYDNTYSYEAADIRSYFARDAKLAALPSFPHTDPATESGNLHLNQLLRWDRIKTGVEVTLKRNGSTVRTVLSPNEWMVRTSSDTELPQKTWSRGGKTIIYSERLGIAASRDATEADSRPWPLDLGDGSFSPYQPDSSLTATKDGDTLTLTSSSERIIIDTRRNVLLKAESLQFGLVSESLVLENFVEVGGIWWARKSTRRNANGKIIDTQTLTVRELDAEAEFEKECQLPADSLTIPSPLPGEGAARKSFADGTAGTNELLALLHISRQEKITTELLTKLKGSAKDWIEWIFSITPDAAAQRLAKRLAQSPKVEGDLILAERLADQIDALRPVYKRHGMDWKWRLSKASTMEDFDILIRDFPRNREILDSALSYYLDSESGIARALQLLSKKEVFDSFDPDVLSELVDPEMEVYELSEITYHYLKANPSRIYPSIEFLAATFFFEGEKASTAQAKRWLDSIQDEKDPEQIEAMVDAVLDYYDEFPGTADTARLGKIAKWFLDRDSFDYIEITDPYGRSSTLLGLNENLDEFSSIIEHARASPFSPELANFLNEHDPEFDIKTVFSAFEAAEGDEKIGWANLILILDTDFEKTPDFWRLFAKGLGYCPASYEEWSLEVESIFLNSLPDQQIDTFLESLSDWALNGRATATAPVDFANRLRTFSNKPNLSQVLVSKLRFKAASLRLLGKGEWNDAADDLFSILDSDSQMTEGAVKLLSRACIDLPAGEAKPIGDRLLKWLTETPDAIEWRHEKYRLLVALGRTDELEAALKEWIRPNDAMSSWLRALAHLHASKGELKEAIAQFERIENEFSDLKKSDYMAMADWYLLSGDKENHRRHKAKALPLEELLQMVADGDTTALSVMEESDYTEGDVDALLHNFRQTQNPRILELLPGAMIREEIGSLFPSRHSQLDFLSIQDEASIDALSRGIQKARKSAKNGASRGILDKLEFEAMCHASKIVDQPDDYEQRAIGILEKFTGANGLTALAGSGRSASKKIAAAHAQAMRRLFESAEGFHDTSKYVAWLFGYGATKEALTLVEKEMKKRSERKPAEMPEGWLEFIAMATESALDEGFEKKATALIENERKRGWYRSADVELHGLSLLPILYSIEELADRDGIGKRIRRMRIAGLYSRLEKEIPEGLPTWFRMAYLGLLVEAADYAADAGAKSVVKSLFSTVDVELEALAAGDFAGMNEDVLDELSSAPLPVVLKVIEVSPDHLLQSDDWIVGPGDLNDAVNELEDFPDLEARLWESVERILRIQLAGDGVDMDICERKQKDSFWKEKAGSMADAAVTFGKKHPQSARITGNVLAFLLEDLKDHERGIAFGLAHQKALDPSGRNDLCLALLKAKRAGEALPISRKLVLDDPSPQNWATHIRVADANGWSVEQLQKLLNKAAKHEGYYFLAQGCAHTKLKPEAFGLFVRGGQFTAPQIADLSAKMKRYDVAIQAAIDTGSYEMVSKLPDVYDFSDFLEAEVKRSGFDNLGLRKDLARECLERKQPALAAQHFAAALELAPNDFALRTELIAAHDAAKNGAKALQVSLAGIGQPGTPLEWYSAAYKRFNEAGQKTNAERALTSILEARPGEEQAFTALARALQEQDRWEAAVNHWRSAREAAGVKVAANFGLAEALIHVGKSKEARGILSRLKKDKTLSEDEQNALVKLEGTLGENSP